VSGLVQLARGRQLVIEKPRLEDGMEVGQDAVELLLSCRDDLDLLPQF
jgi:hypothetical protein